MKTMPTAASTAALLVLLSPAAFAADIGDLTAEEFYGAKYFSTAIEHPQVAKHSSRAKQIQVVARDLGWRSKKLTKAIDKFESLPGEAAALAKKAILKGVESTRAKGRVLDVLINDSEPKHVVVYIRFRGTRTADVVRDAATIANVVSKKTPFISTLSISAIHPKSPATSTKSVWSAKIGSASMGSIDAKRIEDYGDRLYGRLFEEVKTRPF